MSRENRVITISIAVEGLTFISYFPLPSPSSDFTFTISTFVYFSFIVRS